MSDAEVARTAAPATPTSPAADVQPPAATLPSGSLNRGVHRQGSPDESPSATPSSRTPKIGVSRVTSRQLQQDAKKPRNFIAATLIVVLLARLVSIYLREARITERTNALLDIFDVDHDHRLSQADMSRLLDSNGLEFTQEQVKRMFGQVDEEGDGYDSNEVARILALIKDLPAVSKKVRDLSEARGWVSLDVMMTLLTGSGLVYIVFQYDQLERKWAASSFRNAVQVSRMQNRCSKLHMQLVELTNERERLERNIREVQLAVVDAQQKESQLKVLTSELEAVQAKEAETKRQMEEEVIKLQAEAKRCMEEASRAKSKMERVMSCVKGIDSLTGAGMNKFKDEGAQRGFCSGGFAMDAITFGTIEDGQLLVFETARSRKIGDGRDGAFKCTDLSTGVDYALKMYSTTSKEQGRSILNDLRAYRSQVSRHPNIVSYVRVIESESMLFVLMELLKGSDLFNVVLESGLTEAQARPLFRELTEALNHLHGRGVLHCDIKPENAFVTGRPGTETCHLKLIDFGASCFPGSDIGGGHVICDLYMPPEHAERPGVPTPQRRFE